MSLTPATIFRSLPEERRTLRGTASCPQTEKGCPLFSFTTPITTLSFQLLLRIKTSACSNVSKEMTQQPPVRMLLFPLERKPSVTISK